MACLQSGQVELHQETSLAVAQTYPSTSPWKIDGVTKKDVQNYYAELVDPIPLFHSKGAFAFYSHDPDKAVQKGFTKDSVVLSNHYCFEKDELYAFEVPVGYVHGFLDQDEWTDDLRFLACNNSETHIMLLKAAWFNDFPSFMSTVGHYVRHAQ